MEKKEYCSTNGYVKYAGMHLIIELRGARGISSIAHIRRILKESVKACGATLLEMNLHKFNPSGGISGIAVIQESNISIHSWPEYNYAAIDILVCGEVNPYKVVPILKKRFKPKDIQVMELKRGIL